MKKTELLFKTMPVPAARVRVTRFGSYFPKTYTDFKNAFNFELQKIKAKYPPTDGLFIVELEFICRRPKNPSNKYPRGDCDNFAKAPLDSFTNAGMFWNDDVQIISLHATKRYQKTNEDFGIRIILTELSEEEASSLL